MTKTRQPKEMHAKFPGKCDECGRHVSVGELILWLARGKIKCNDCIPTQTPRETPSDHRIGDKWADALSWQHIEPSKPVAVVAPNTPKPEKSRDPYANNPKLARKPDETEGEQATRVWNEVKPLYINSDSLERLPELDTLSQLAFDLMVTCVNTLSNLDVEQREIIRTHADWMANNSDLQERRFIWRRLHSAVMF